jgi:malonyl-CoA/methylmalonyl-CoA synthetase
VVLKDRGALDLQSLRTWAGDFLAAYKLPSRLRVLEALPRNAMGKVMKPSLASLFQIINSDGAAKP